MNCPYPEHHSSGGGWGGPIAAIFTAMIAAVVLGPLLHWLEIALACLGIGAAITVGLVARRRWRDYQAAREALQQGYVPYLQPQPHQRQFQAQQPHQRQFQAQQPPQAVQDGGQHLHLHLGELSPAERDRVMRQLRGGQPGS